MRRGHFEVRPLSCDYCDLKPLCRLVALPTDPEEAVAPPTAGRSRDAARCRVAELRFTGRSAVVQAGAGTGKTHNLVSLCIQLLGGATPIPPARLWAVTFTEKAAGELKGRIRARVDELAAEDPAFRRVRRDLGLAQIGTIHSLCAQNPAAPRGGRRGGSRLPAPRRGGGRAPLA